VKGGYTGCVAMLLLAFGSACIGYVLGGQAAMIVGLIGGSILSLPLYFLVNRFAPGKAERQIQEQIGQKLTGIQNYEERIRIARENEQGANRQLESFRSWRGSTPS
jgi:hypothetical protein